MNADENSRTPSRYGVRGVRGIPTLILHTATMRVIRDPRPDRVRRGQMG